MNKSSTRSGWLKRSLLGVYVQAVGRFNQEKALAILARHHASFGNQVPNGINGHLVARSHSLVTDAAEWLWRGHVNARIARGIVSKKEPGLLVEAVTQLQQAAEKASKGLMIANGMPYEDVVQLQHNTSGAFMELLIHVMAQHKDSLDWNGLDLGGGPAAGEALIMLIFPKDRRTNRKVKLLAIWRSLFENIEPDATGLNTDWRWWREQTGTWSEDAIRWVLRGHVEYRRMWDRYIARMKKASPERKADPRPLLTGAVEADTWVFDREYAGLSEWFVEGDFRVNLRSSHREAIRAFCNYARESALDQIGSSPLPSGVLIEPILNHIRDYTSAFLFLYVVGIITTPHATTSRYPADRSEAGRGSMGTQDYDDQLGVIRCIRPLSYHTEASIRRLRRGMDFDTWLCFD